MGNQIKKITFLLIFIFLVPPHLSAQPVPNVWAVPFAVEPVYILNAFEPCEASEVMCRSYPDDLILPDPANPDYNRQLSGVIPEAVGRDVYIVGCADMERGTVCSSGSPSTDALLRSWGYSFTSSNDFVFTPGPSSSNEERRGNPIRTNENGEFWIMARSYTRIITFHTFFAVYQRDAASVTRAVTQAPRISITTSVRAQNQMHMLPPPSPTPTPIPPPQPPSQANARNSGEADLHGPVARAAGLDPKGRVFDATTLEPIANALVTLKKSDGTLPVSKQFDNPQRTLSNGEFYFFVPAGEYTLEVDTLPEGYSWPLTNEQLTQVTSRKEIAKDKMYYCSPSVTNSGESVALYGKQYPITIKDSIIHCDIPVFTLQPKEQPIKAVTTGYTYLKGEHIYSGRITHPFGTVLLTDALGRKMAEVQSDKLGNWTAVIPEADYPKINGAFSELKMEVARYNPDSSKREYIALPRTFQPILRSIDTVARDAFGSPIPNAIVKVRLATADRDASTIQVTQADATGKFTVPVNNIPYFEYSLIYEDPATQDEIELNTSELTIADGNLAGGMPANSPGDDTVRNTPNPDTMSVSSPVTQIIILVVLIGVLLLLAAGAVWFVLKRSK